uniref:Fusion glycoprotein F0 n=1 Tax=avian paramyxovirus 2 TaxID=2560313 RepID=A0A0H4CUJ7_9MONO|nr:fusion protein [Avian metaavulavirus 2]ANO39179.1 fusion protein [Avian metaavulavirus 2]
MIAALFISLFATCGALDNSVLAPVGIASAQEWQLAAYTNTLSGTIAVRFVPVLPGNLSTCAQATLAEYNKTVTNILGPLKENLETLLSEPTKTAARFVGAIIGTVALGVATSAQITAAVALNQAQENARNIWRLKESIRKTNEAVLELKDGLASTAIALDKVQKFINEDIIPQIKEIDCQVVANKLGVYLSLYLTELTTIFGAQITNPALTPLSYQALYNLCGGDMGKLTELIGVKAKDINSLYEANLITGQVIGYDSESQIILIQVSYPSVSEVTGVRATELVTVSVTTPKGEGRAIAPKYVAQSRVVTEELDTSTCRFSKTTLYCRSIITRPLPPLIANCLNGLYQDCQYTTEIGALSSRFITVNGGIIANCRATICKCVNPPKIIVQSDASSLTVIDSAICKDVVLDNVQLRLEGKLSAQYFTNITIDLSQITTSGSLDISSEIGSINNTVNKVEELIAESNAWLQAVNPHLVNNTSIIVLCVLAAIFVVWLVALTGCLAYYIKKSSATRMVGIGSSPAGNPYVAQSATKM